MIGDPAELIRIKLIHKVFKRVPDKVEAREIPDRSKAPICKKTCTRAVYTKLCGVSNLFISRSALQMRQVLRSVY
uniref:Uncharacterized protein n=1 Tax=Candidatus Kentrum sp. FM TaxID=2126340 RepID=A0A450TXE0_9GAMM|nr:MAG: hypothetical protein BECKFM1743A_GA0114220_107252 [Candidatus Kentron sp. FM]VFJ73995.1 MAG: hypothetical protein BECKFM1743C_GA0114222_107642 [Candidatus Kentron sp. FM]VFK21010.1 MAG: hypothetical protein BECKFM1743B_GA0114221_107492 [Candidatus Kentron sp. FM]